MLLVREFESLLARREAYIETADAAAVKPLFVYFAFHMVHMGDGYDSSSEPASASSPPFARCVKQKCLEAPRSYVDRFSRNVTDISRRTFLGMVSLVDEAVGNVTALWADHFGGSSRYVPL
jgi:hypothetical protein